MFCFWSDQNELLMWVCHVSTVSIWFANRPLFYCFFFYHNIPCTEQYTICQMLKEMTQAVARNAIVASFSSSVSQLAVTTLTEQLYLYSEVGNVHSVLNSSTWFCYVPINFMPYAPPPLGLKSGKIIKLSIALIYGADPVIQSVHRAWEITRDLMHSYIRIIF